MAMPLGRIAIGLVGLIVVAVGLYQIYQGFKAGFERQFQTYALTPKEAKLATDVGRFWNGCTREWSSRWWAF